MVRLQLGAQNICLLQWQIESQKSRAGEHERYGHGQEQDVIIYSAGKELAFTGFESELYDQDDGVDESGQLSEQSDDEEQGYDHLHRAVYGAVGAGAGAALHDLLIAEIC